VTVRRFGCAALLGLALVSGRSLQAGEPARSSLPVANYLPALEINDPQKLADTIAAHLRQSGQLHHYRVDVTVRAGEVELTGTVADQPQHDEVLHLVQGVPGVARVIDHLTFTAASSIARVQAETPPVPPPPAPEKDKSRLPAPMPENGGTPAPGSGSAPATNGHAPSSEPLPMFRGPMPSYYALNPPKMPPYAWPTYAPYNNFSRVGYPERYPYNAWPFIGPVFPFPKVPLGWRAVKLEWDDGVWWYSRVGCKYDWWKLRYW
jgi:hypothetical protein